MKAGFIRSPDHGSPITVLLPRSGPGMRSWSRPWSRSRSWCGSRRYCGSRRRSRTYLNFERPDIEATISYAKEIWAALVIKRRRGKTRIARVNGRAAIRQLMRRGVAAVILQRAEQRIGINDRRGRLLVNARLRRALFAQRLGRPPDRFAAANRPRAAECSRSPFLTRLKRVTLF
jgi:hypothetical protein